MKPAPPVTRLRMRPPVDLAGMGARALGWFGSIDSPVLVVCSEDVPRGLPAAIVPAVGCADSPRSVPNSVD